MENLFDISTQASRETATIVALTFLLAGMVKGVIGLGLPTVAVGLLGLLMTPMEAAAIVTAPSLVTNLWQLAAGRNLLPLIRRIWTMLAGICAGTWAGALVFGGGAAAAATVALGIALVIYALAGLASLRLQLAPGSEPWLAPSVGAATGIVTAATGVFVIPAVPYLQALQLGKDDLVQAMGLAFTTSTLALAGALLL